MKKTHGAQLAALAKERAPPPKKKNRRAETEKRIGRAEGSGQAATDTKSKREDGAGYVRAPKDPVVKPGRRGQR